MVNADFFLATSLNFDVFSCMYQLSNILGIIHVICMINAPVQLLELVNYIFFEVQNV